jgi:copper chaperone CopZ
MITVHVPAMTARRDVRAISACISDVPGVQTLQADLATGTVQVTGSADPAAITAAVIAAGYIAAGYIAAGYTAVDYAAVDYTAAPSTDFRPPPGSTRTGPSGVQTRRHHRAEEVQSTPTLDHRPETHDRPSRRSS